MKIGNNFFEKVFNSDWKSVSVNVFGLIKSVTTTVFMIQFAAVTAYAITLFVSQTAHATQTALQDVHVLTGIVRAS